MLATGATAVRGAVPFLGQPARPWTRSSLSKASQSPELRPGTKAPLWWSVALEPRASFRDQLSDQQHPDGFRTRRSRTLSKRAVGGVDQRVSTGLVQDPSNPS